MAATSRNAAGVIRQTTPRHPDNLSNLNICAVPAAAAGPGGGDQTFLHPVSPRSVRTIAPWSRT